jgi:quercetin dioxygenase-like cupin family protein
MIRPAVAVKLSLLVLVSAASGSIATIAAQAVTIHSSVWEWRDLKFQPNAIGSRVQVVRAPTPTLDELEIHVSTLNVGQVSHPPHKHPEEELLIVKEGTVETLQNGVPHKLGPGSIIFQASNEMHNIRNAGSTPATYHVIQWRVPAARK